jgi:epoxyqueuosine reductase
VTEPSGEFMASSSDNALTRELLNLALTAGFDDAGVCRARAYPEMARVREWIDAGHHAGMDYMARWADKRMNPQMMVPFAEYALMVVKSYPPAPSHAAEPSPDGEYGTISAHAAGADYHNIMKSGLKKLSGVLRQAGYNARPFVDTAPVAERILAVRAGLGKVAANTLFYHPRFGSWVFLGGLYTDAPLEAAEVSFQTSDECADCGRCAQICPAGALSKPGTLDARKCLAYWTIEAKSRIPVQIADKARGWVFGCDLCQLVCPMNQRVHGHGTTTATCHYLLDELSSLGPEGFTSTFAGTTIARLGWERFLNNVETARNSLHHQRLEVTRK